MIVQRDLTEDFPVKNNVAYFNNASYTPMGRAATRAISDALTRYSNMGPSDNFYLKLREAGNATREKLALMLNVGKEDIVFTESATQSINLVANGFRFTPDDVIVTRGGSSEHPSNYLPWRYFADRKSVRIVDLEPDELGLPNLSQLDSVLKETRTKLVVMSHVLYNLGTIMPVKEAAKISHERGARFFLDASQSIGAMAVNLSDIDCDYAAGTAAKWLCGPLGLGFIYSKKEALDSLEPLSFGANACTYDSDGSYRIHDNASKLEEGFRNWIYCHGLDAAIEVLKLEGIEDVRERNLNLADSIIEGLNVKSCQILGTRDNNKRTSILPFELFGIRPIDVVQRLAERRITVAEREIRERKILRISPHFYNDADEVALLLGELDAVFRAVKS